MGTQSPNKSCMHTYALAPYMLSFVAHIMQCLAKCSIPGLDEKTIHPGELSCVN